MRKKEKACKSIDKLIGCEHFSVRMSISCLILLYSFCFPSCGEFHNCKRQDEERKKIHRVIVMEASPRPFLDNHTIGWNCSGSYLVDFLLPLLVTLSNRSNSFLTINVLEVSSAACRNVYGIFFPLNSNKLWTHSTLTTKFYGESEKEVFCDLLTLASNILCFTLECYHIVYLSMNVSVNTVITPFGLWIQLSDVHSYEVVGMLSRSLPFLNQILFS